MDTEAATATAEVAALFPDPPKLGEHLACLHIHRSVLVKHGHMVGGKNTALQK